MLTLHAWQVGNRVVNDLTPEERMTRNIPKHVSKVRCCSLSGQAVAARCSTTLLWLLQMRLLE
jgi:hypothetical protein